MRKTLLPGIAFALLAAPLLAQQEVPSAERTLLQLANRDRAAQGIPPLTWDPALARAAMFHDQRMMHETNDLEHQYPGEPDLPTRAARAGAHFSTVAENLAAGGPDAAVLHRKWMSSPIHRANLLDPNLTALGIAVLENSGTLYAVEDFGRTVAVLQHSDANHRAQQLLREQGIQSNATPAAAQDARRNCTAPGGIAPSTATHPILVIRWEGSDLTQLPAAVLQQMPAARAHTAAVATCPTQQANNANFTSYRVTVLLY